MYLLLNAYTMPSSWVSPADVGFTPVEIVTCLRWRNLFQTKDTLNDAEDIWYLCNH